MTRCRAVVAAALCAAACGGSDAGPTPAPSPSAPAAATCTAGTPVTGTPALTTRLLVRGLQAPLDLQAVPGDPTRVFVVEQAGRIRIVRGGAVAATFLDIVSRVGSGGERGLLGLAFHPRYATNGRFFVNYTDRSGDTHISEFRVSSNPDAADAASEGEVMFVRQPFANHNGGGLAFGPDGMLYIGLGDGGSGGDPQGNGQRLDTRLGKMLRVDVDSAQPFGVPPDNPFVVRAGALPEIWSYGLRNPWRFAFDTVTGDLLIGDVGQNAIEEIDLGGRRGGENYGWNEMEGSQCFRTPSCNRTGLTLPITEYTHAGGHCSVTGGVVYRGCRMPGYHGTYFYGDYCSAIVRSFRVANGQAVDPRDWTSALSRDLDAISSFGTDADGEVYIVDHRGAVYQVVPAS